MNNYELREEAQTLTDTLSQYALAMVYLQKCEETDKAMTENSHLQGEIEKYKHMLQECELENESQTEEKNMTLDEFDTKLKTLLMDAGKSGVDVRSIFVDNSNTSTNTEECYILNDYKVEYSRGGR